MIARNLSFLLPLVLLGAMGCGSNTGLPEGETGTVQGKITFEGQPVPEGCQVIFIGSKNGILGTAVTTAGGAYSLSMRGGANVLVGTYRVAISPPKENPGLSDEEIAKLAMENKLPKSVPVREVPDHYRSPETTPASADVKAGSNTVDIDMKSKK